MPHETGGAAHSGGPTGNGHYTKRGGAGLAYERPRDRVSIVQAGAATREAFARASRVRLSGNDYRILAALVSLTLTYCRLADRISNAQLGQVAGVKHASTVRASLARLREAGVIWCEGIDRDGGIGRVRMIGFYPASEATPPGNHGGVEHVPVGSTPPGNDGGVGADAASTPPGKRGGVPRRGTTAATPPGNRGAVREGSSEEKVSEENPRPTAADAAGLINAIEGRGTEARLAAIHVAIDRYEQRSGPLDEADSEWIREWAEEVVADFEWWGAVVLFDEAVTKLPHHARWLKTAIGFDADEPRGNGHRTRARRGVTTELATALTEMFAEQANPAALAASTTG